ncbi:ethanolamine ammonia lyase-activating protein [Thermodesulfobacteriota bacterium]
MVNKTEALPEILPDERTAFEKWVESEGLDLLGGFYVEDLKTLPLKPWARKGGLGVYIKLEGTRWENAAYVCEIPQGGTLEPQRHLFEETIYIVKGLGATKVWNDSGAEQTFEWNEGSLFTVPLNCWHQHFNASGVQVVRYVAVTLAPTMISLFRNTDFIFSTPFDFKERFNGEEGYFSGTGEAYRFSKGFTGAIFETNFLYDLPNFGLRERKERGAGGAMVWFEMAGSSMGCHVSEFPVGTYKKGHRHRPGAHVIIIKGQGYSLMWPEGEPIQRIDWHEGSMVVPPGRWWHQHFNTGNTPVRYLAIHATSSRKFKVGTKIGVAKSVKEGGDQIEYEDEMPEIREMFEKELAKSGVTAQMPWYTKKG